MRILITLMISCSGTLLFAQSTVTKEEYGIYSLVLNSMFREDRREHGVTPDTHYLFLTQTGTDAPLPADFRDRVSKSFNNRKQISILLEPRFRVRFSYSLVEEAGIKKLLEQSAIEAEMMRKQSGSLQALDFCNESEWRLFWKTYPRSNGYHRLSRIGFSRDHRLAYVEIEGTGSSWDADNYYSLEWTKKGWKLIDYGGGFRIC